MMRVCPASDIATACLSRTRAAMTSISAWESSGASLTSGCSCRSKPQPRGPICTAVSEICAPMSSGSMSVTLKREPGSHPPSTLSYVTISVSVLRSSSIIVSRVSAPSRTICIHCLLCFFRFSSYCFRMYPTAPFAFISNTVSLFCFRSRPSVPRMP